LLRLSALFAAVACPAKADGRQQVISAALLAETGPGLANIRTACSFPTAMLVNLAPHIHFSHGNSSIT
jgi:hypothetical protein